MDNPLLIVRNDPEIVFHTKKSNYCISKTEKITIIELYVQYASAYHICIYVCVCLCVCVCEGDVLYSFSI